ncbi:tetratricopeptide repeat protein, partial [Schaalia cardiffensis]
MVNELLGPHIRIVDDLLKQLRDIQNGDTASPRVVVLEGPSGVGKTRIIQELYQKLRENDPYWPPMQEPVRVETAGADPMAARKLVAPNPKDFTWPAGALPSFGWWGLNCERLSRGSYLDAVAELRPQLDAHTVPLMLALEERRSSWEKLAAFAAPLKTTLKELRTTYSEEGTAQAIDGVLELLIEGATGASVSLDFVAPGLATLLKLGWRGLKASNERALNQDDLRMTIDQGERVRGQHQSRSVELAQALADFTHASFPVVVAVEDIHLMGDDFSKFLSTLVARKERSIMVVATTWPERNAEDPFSQWLEDAEEADTAVRIAVPNLDEEDLVLLVKSHAPNTTDDVARAVATQLPNPHYVRLWLTTDRIERQIQRDGDAVVLEDSEFRVPIDVYEMLRLRWRSLESHIQQALCLAVAINPIEDPLCSFVPGVLEDLAASSAFLNSEEISEGAVRAVDPAQWCRIAEGVEAFTEALLADQSRTEAENVFASHEVAAFKISLKDIIAEYIRDSSEGGIWLPLEPRILNLVTWQQQLALRGEVSLENIAGIFALARAAELRNNLEDAFTLSKKAVERIEQSGICNRQQHLSILIFHAMIVARVSHSFEYGEVLLELIHDFGSEYGFQLPDTFPTWTELVSLLGEVGRVNEAITEFEALLEDQQRVLGANHPNALRTRFNLARWLGEAGRVDEAITRLEALLKDQQRILGPDHPDTLAT